MKVSVNTVKQYIDFELPPVDELVARINQQLGQVEEVIDLASKYKDVTIVKVVACEKHPNADRLSVCLIDDGGVTTDIERDTEGRVRVVCGAPNVREGIFAAWLPPRSTVPASFGTDEPFVLDARELRGVKSNGMLAAADELSLWSDHEGIIEIDPMEWRPNAVEVVPGTSFAKAFGLDDTVIDIENKMFTHRPDLFGQIGVAREIAGILGHTFTSPTWYTTAPAFSAADGLGLKVFNEAGDKCPRFMTVALKDVTVKPSPLWLKIELVRLGGKPINNIVDATNYVMLLTAQPTHAYDYDKLRGKTLGVRMAHDGEAATLLNNKLYTLTSDDIVIVDGEGIVGLGGVMGGGNSEVSDTTTNIVLEVAAFDMYAVRKTSMRNGLFTDAVTRFNKGQSPLQQPYILQLLTMSVNDVAGGAVASSVSGTEYNDTRVAQLAYDADFINQRLGTTLTPEEVKELLVRVEFGVEAHTAKIPFWRTDIECEEDIVEEVGRLYGFDKLPRVLPRRSIEPAAENARRVLKQCVRNVLSRSGANEVLTYSFVHERVLASAGQDVSHAYRLSNALSPELQYYRLSILPSLLDKVNMDIRAGYDEFALFEIGKGHSKALELDEEGLPSETESIDLVIAHKQSQEGAPFYQARRVVEYLLDSLDVDAVYQPIDTAQENDAWTPFELSRSAQLMTRDGVLLGIVGELRAEVRAKFKLPDYVAAASLSIDVLETLTHAKGSHYKVLSRYPSISRDVSLRTKADVSYHELFHAVWHVVANRGDELDVTIEPVGIYQADGDASLKTTTFHIELTSGERTLQDSDANPLVEAIARGAGEALGAELV